MSPGSVGSLSTASVTSNKKKRRKTSCHSDSFLVIYEESFPTSCKLSKKSIDLTGLSCGKTSSKKRLVGELKRLVRQKKRTVPRDLNPIEQTTQSVEKNSDSLQKISSELELKMAGCKRKRCDDQIPATNEYVALDCEFVGVGRNAHSALGRCSVVDYDGHILCDIYAKPDEPVTDYRTRWSGIRPRDLVNAVPFENARNIVRAAIKDRIVVGHAVYNDFKVLNINHPVDRVRDTSKYKPLRRKAGLPVNALPSLKKLALGLLGLHIQAREHSSVEDARATMDVFKVGRVNWEQEILSETERRQNRVTKRFRIEVNTDTGSSSSSSSSTLDDEDDDNFSFLSDTFWPDDLER